MEPASKRSMDSTADTEIVLSPDVLWEILLRVPAKPLCRLRAACRSWRFLLSEPSFVKAHAALRPGLVLSLAGENDRIDMTDLSGTVVRRISIAPQDAGVLHDAHPGQFYLFLDHNRVRVVDPDTGAVSTLPLDHLQNMVGSSYEALYALGRAASTGQHKVLRVVTRYNYPANPLIEQHCHVFTLGDDDRPRCWRPMASAPLCVKFHIACCHMVSHNAVIQGVVYLLPDRKYPSFDVFPTADSVAIDTNRVMSFDLEAEEWRPATLPGPPSINDTEERCELKLAKLNGSLVMLRHTSGYRDYPTVQMDLWFATDLERGAWVKERSIRLEMPTSRRWLFAPDVQLLMVLEDRRVVFYYSENHASGNWSWPDPQWRTRIYDPRTKSCADVPQHGVRFIGGMYRGSMLCLGSQ